MFNPVVGVKFMDYITGEHRLQSILFSELLDNYVSQENPNTRWIYVLITNLK